MKEYINGIPYLKYENENNKKAVIMFHGLAEHMNRYEEVANYLYNSGINVYVIEYRGHGELRKEEIVDFGVDGVYTLLSDVDKFMEKFKTKYEQNLIIFGHSFGSILALYVAIKYKMENVILSALPIQDKFMIQIGTLIATIEKKFGVKRSSLNKMIVRFNREYKLDGEFSWISRDKEEVLKYFNDPNCGFELTPNFFLDMGFLLRYVKKNINNIKDNSRILVIVGENDPVISKTKIIKYLHKIKDKSVKKDLCIIAEGRHDTLKEINKEKVFKKIKNWILGD